MSIYTYEVKQDKHKIWTKLSVSTKHPMQDYEMASRAEYYAISTQVNPDTVAIRCLNMDGTEVARVDSDATVNRPTMDNRP